MSIIPVQLAPFEHFMLADDCPDYPKSFFIHMKFQGRFDRPQLTAALKAALKLHPLLNSRIRGSATEGTSRIAWIESTSQPPAIDWNDAEIPFRFATGRWMDLKSETGLRLWLRESEDSTTLILQIHHSCCDGLGAYNFIQTLLMVYHQLYTSSSISTEEDRIDLRLLRDRDLSCSSWGRLFKTTWHGIYRVSRYFKSSPVPLATPCALPANNIGEDQFPKFHTRTFDTTNTRQLRVTARRLGAGLNDLLLRDLFLILDRWNRRHSPDHRSRNIRVCMPVNLGRPIDHRMPAANVVSLAFLDREPNQFSDAVRLLADLHTENTQTKRLRESLAFVPALKLLGMFPGRLHARMQRVHCKSSSVLSNLGVLFNGSALLGRDRRMVAGGVILESVEAVLPLHPLTHVAFLASNYGAKLSLTISHDPRWIDAAAVRELLESYVRQLTASLEQSNDNRKDSHAVVRAAAQRVVEEEPVKALAGV